MTDNLTISTAEGNVEVATADSGGVHYQRVGHDVTDITSGRKVVTSAGTRVALAASTPAKSVLIQAETDNTGVIVVGSAAGVIAALGTRVGAALNAGDAVEMRCANLEDIGLDSTVSGDGVTWMAEV